MLQQRTTGLIALCLSGIASLSQVVQAQDKREPWYQVDVVVFKRLSINHNEHPAPLEQLGLHYPKAQRFLIDAEHTTAGQETAASNHSEEGQPFTPLADTLVANSFLRRLPKSQAQLQDQVGSLRRSKNQRVLFQGSWNQRLESAKEAPAIPIQGGESFDEHSELEGYIRLSISRYLHIDTHLWLSRFVDNGFNEVGNWAQLPAFPTRPQARLAQPLTKAQDRVLEGQGFEAQDIDAQAQTVAPLYLGETTNNPLALRGTLDDQTLNTLNTPNTPNSRQFHVESIEQLKQKRRMRSGELHYIDHPAFGLLVQLTPIDPPNWPFNNTIKAMPSQVLENTDQASQNSAATPLPTSE